MLEEVFLVALGLVWVIFAVIQDLKKREIANWLNFSLVIFALGFRFFYSLFGNLGYDFFYYGVLSFGFFFVIGNLLYYGKVFAGGDAKLMIALGAVIPFSRNFFINLNLILYFLLFFLMAGALYGIIFSLVLGIKNRKGFMGEFSNYFRKKKNIFYLALFLSLVFIILSFFIIQLFFVAVLVFISPYVYFSAKSIDQACMIKKIDSNKLTEGDWLYKDLKLGKTMIKAKWEGLSKKEISLIKKERKEIFIRQGIPFGPVFLIGYLALVYIWIQKLYFFF